MFQEGFVWLVGFKLIVAGLVTVREWVSWYVSEWWKWRTVAAEREGFGDQWKDGFLLATDVSDWMIVGLLGTLLAHVIRVSEEWISLRRWGWFEFTSAAVGAICGDRIWRVSGFCEWSVDASSSVKWHFDSWCGIWVSHWENRGSTRTHTAVYVHSHRYNQIYRKALIDIYIYIYICFMKKR